MVGLVLVSHSNKLANATLSLVRSMSGDEVIIAIAAGVGENYEELGTDAMEIHQAILHVLDSENNNGVVIIMDIGSAVISADIALDFLDNDMRTKVAICPSAFVEGAIAAGVASKIGGDIDFVVREAKLALKQKIEHLGESLEDNFNINYNQENQKHENSISKNVTIPILNGLHMRPVTELVRLLRNYKSDIKLKNLSNGKGPVSARSMTEILSIEALYNNSLQITVSGDDAENAITEIIQAINSGLGDSLAKETSHTPGSHIKSKPIGISRGVAIAPAYYLEQKNIIIPNQIADNPNEEIEKLKNAINEAKENLSYKSKIFDKGDIFKAQMTLLEDPNLLDKAIDCIIDKRFTAISAWNMVLEEIIERYQNFENTNFRERASDLMDLKQIVLKKLGINIENHEEIKILDDRIIIAEDLTPNQVYSLDINLVKGVICMKNAPTSHSSILLRSRGIPSIVYAEYADSSLRNLPENSIVAMDGETGEIITNPDNYTTKHFTDKQNAIKELKFLEKQNNAKPAITKDGERIEIFANVGKIEDVHIALENGTEGIGLLRTEFMFIGKNAPPTENEQVDNLYHLLKNMNEKPIIIRTLDAGGDKQIPYLNISKEENPFLGVRAIRISLRNKQMFQEQLRAILRVGKDFDISIMFPMISTMPELIEAKNQLSIAHKSLVHKNISHKWPIKTGIMVEVPSVAIMAEEFAKEVDFFSIGTNDLTQYTMAMDRGNPELYNSFNGGLDKSIKKLIKNIVISADKIGIPVSVCGEAASDPDIVPVLISLGIRKLSISPSNISQIKFILRNTPFLES